MKAKEIIEMLRVCANEDIQCLRCPRYEIYTDVGSVACFIELMLEAADALEDALREQEERRWISVKDRLPEKAGTYFVVTKTGAVTFARFYPERDVKDCTGKFIRHEKGNFQTNRNVIYWMPLPEPPKEDSE